MKEKKLHFEQKMTREDMVFYLEDLASSLRRGKIVIEQEGRFVSLDPPGTVKLNLSAKTKKDKGELSIEISWKEETQARVGMSGLRISSDEPEPPAPVQPEADAGADDDDDDDEENEEEDAAESAESDVERDDDDDDDNEEKGDK